MNGKTVEQPSRFQFNLRSFLLIVASAAAVTATAASPGKYSGLLFLGFATAMPGVMLVMALSKGPLTKSVCLPAIVPMIFGLHAIGWAFGWTVYNSTGVGDLITWFGKSSETIKTVTLCSWVFAIFAGATGFSVRKLMD